MRKLAAATIGRHAWHDVHLATTRSICCLIRHMDANGHLLRAETVVDGRRQTTCRHGAGNGLAQEWLLTTDVDFNCQGKLQLRSKTRRSKHAKVDNTDSRTTAE